MMVFFLLSLRHVVDAVGNPKTIVGFVLLELLGECCHLVPDDDDGDADDEDDDDECECITVYEEEYL